MIKVYLSKFIDDNETKLDYLGNISTSLTHEDVRC